MAAAEMQHYLDQLDTMREAVGKIDSDFLAGWTALSTQGGKEGALSYKTKELICIALGVAAHCSYCIASHVNKAVHAGASRREIMEAGFVAVKMGGGPSMAYMTQVIAACDEFKAK
jgi:AhpD family alkylhydroperoxidase